jgi:DNA-binding transcriptional MerR regulator
MRIGELAERSGVSVRSLRYYEQQKLLEPRRPARGQRVYGAEHQTLVAQIQELFHAGFCSSVIRDLLPALRSSAEDEHLLKSAFDAAAARLESEKRSIEAELYALAALRARLKLAPDAGVTVQGGEHDPSPSTPPTPFDHRDRRLR